MAKNRLQFSIARMLALTAVCAGTAALANVLGGPAVVRGTIAVLLILAAAYFVLRVPYLYQQIRIAMRDLRRLRRKEAALNARAMEKKRKIQEARDAADRASRLMSFDEQDR